MSNPRRVRSEFFFSLCALWRWLYDNKLPRDLRRKIVHKAHKVLYKQAYRKQLYDDVHMRRSPFQHHHDVGWFRFDAVSRVNVHIRTRVTAARAIDEILAQHQSDLKSVKFCINDMVRIYWDRSLRY